MSEHIQIQGITPRIQYVADGTQTIFEFPFAIFKNENIKVYLGDSLQANEAYFITGAGGTTGGTVIFENAPAAGVIVTLLRDLMIERTSDFQEGGVLRAGSLNDELDYQIACQQQIADALNRSMVLPPYAANVDVDLTLPLPQAGKAIVWNSDGTNLENSTVSVNALASTLNGYKEVAETASANAAAKAEEATNAAIIATQKATQATNTLANKVDKDMDNLTDAGKKNIVNLCLPDYTAGVSIRSGAGSVTFTAPTDGIIMGQLDFTTGVTPSVKVDGYTVGGGQTYPMPLSVPISQNQVFTATAVEIYSEVIFYPMKGTQNA